MPMMIERLFNGYHGGLSPRISYAVPAFIFRFVKYFDAPRSNVAITTRDCSDYSLLQGFKPHENDDSSGIVPNSESNGSSVTVNCSLVFD